MYNLTGRPVSMRACRLVLIPFAILAGGLVFSAAPASATEGGRPMIENVTATKVYEHEGTLEAQINPEGSETTYEIWLECQSAHEPFWPCEPIMNSQRIEGHIAAGFEAKTVSLHLAGLQPGFHYWYGVAAANSAGRTESRVNIFIDSVIPPGACPNGCGKNEQYGSETPQWYTKLSNEESAQTLKEYEAKHAKGTGRTASQGSSQSR